MNMYIPLRKPEDKRNIILLEKKNVSCPNFDNILTEVAHRFQWQYEIAELLGGLIHEALKLNKKKLYVNLERYNTIIKGVDINIDDRRVIPGINAEFDDINDDGYAILNIHVYQHFKLFNDGRNTLLNDIKGAIMHELLHVKMGMERLSKKRTPFPLPESYNDYIKVLSILSEDGRTIDDDLYALIYSLYSVNHTEIPAFVSQCYCEVKDTLSNYKELNNNIFKYALKNSNVYETYVLLRDRIQQMSNKDDNSKNYLIKEINQYCSEININTINIINNTYQYLLDMLNRAIRDCENCAVEAYYHIEKKHFPINI